MIARVLRRDGEAVGALRLREGEGAPLRWRLVARLEGLRAAVAPSVVERLEALDRDALDVAANGSFREAERHPRLEVRDDARLHLRVRVQIVVQSIGPRVHERPQPRGARRVLRPERVRIDEELLAQVLIDRALAFGFGKPAERVDVIRLDAIEVVLGLRVHHSEHRIGIRVSVHVRDAPVVAHDAGALRLLAPARDLGGWRDRGGRGNARGARGRRAGDERRDERDEDEGASETRHRKGERERGCRRRSGWNVRVDVRIDVRGVATGGRGAPRRRSHDAVACARARARAFGRTARRAPARARRCTP